MTFTPQDWLMDGNLLLGHTVMQTCFLFSATCLPWEFTCSSGECVAFDSRCNGRQECSDGSDERNCSTTTTTCHDYEFQCANGRCIFNFWLCDGDNDCGDGSDEAASRCCKRSWGGGEERGREGGEKEGGVLMDLHLQFLVVGWRQ